MKSTLAQMSGFSAGTRAVFVASGGQIDLAWHDKGASGSAGDTFPDR